MTARVQEQLFYGYWNSVAPDVRNVKDAADAFESMLWQMVLKESFKSLPEGSFFNSRGEKGIYSQIVIWKLADYVSKSVETEIGRKIYEKFSGVYRNTPPRPIYKVEEKHRGGVS